MLTADMGSATAHAMREGLRACIGAPPLNSPGHTLRRMVRRGMSALPFPGSGGTLTRWQALSEVAAHDLSLVKLFEGHTDALATMDELGAAPQAPPDATWGLWAAEAPGGRVLLDDPDSRSRSSDRVRLHGRKCWCSGAAELSHALLTAWHTDGSGPYLVAVELAQPGVRVTQDGWHAVGMSASASVDVSFDGAPARRIGTAGDYLARPGFWQGACGIAACWLGGARALAETLRGDLHRHGKTGDTPFRWMALGQVDVALTQTAATLREAAAWIDANPHADASTWALRTRLSAESAADKVLATVGHALGATPFCRDPAFARLAADLPVFIRQSHAERDQVALAERIVRSASTPWTL
jgi:hypothetical protein